VSKQTKKKPARRPRPPAGQRLGQPLKIYRPHALAALLSVDPATLWRWWAKLGILPPPREFSETIHGWTEEEVATFLESRPRMRMQSEVSSDA
jgi:predicted DNA-binding transcriptional regulator AlpA